MCVRGGGGSSKNVTLIIIFSNHNKYEHQYSLLEFGDEKLAHIYLVIKH